MRTCGNVKFLGQVCSEVLPKSNLTNPLTNVYLMKLQRTHKVQEQLVQDIKRVNNIQEEYFFFL